MAGDREALGRLFTRDMRRLYRTALYILASPEDAEDALQDGFLSATLNLHRFEGRSRFSTWLTRIVVNAALMRLRHRQAHVVMSLDSQVSESVDFAWIEDLADSRPDPEQICMRQERGHILRRRLRGLPLLHRSTVSLCDVEGIPVREVAQTLGVSVATLKSRLRRARMRVTRTAPAVLSTDGRSIP